METLIEMEKIGGRIDALDIAKGIAIISVIAGHYLQDYHSSYMNYVFCFHVALFFLLSGYFLNIEYDFHTFVKKKTIRLLKPYIITSAIWCGLMSLKECIKSGLVPAVKQLIKCVYAVLFGGGQGKGSFYLSPTLEWKAIGCEAGMLWFLLALFWGSIIVYLICKIKSRWLQAIMAIMIVIVGYFSSKVITLPWSIQQGMFAVGFIYIGFIARKLDMYKLIGKDIPCDMLFVSGVILIFIMGKYSLFEMYSNYCKVGFLDYAAALIISFAIVVLSFYIDKAKVSFIPSVFSWIGCNSLLLLCIHFLDVGLFGFIARRVFEDVCTNDVFLLMVTMVISMCQYCMVISVILKFKKSRKEAV